MSARHSMPTINYLIIGLIAAFFCVFTKVAMARDNSEAPVKQLFKIDQNGDRLPADSKQWECVEDAETSLLWEKRAPSNPLHNVHDTYSWYQPAETPAGQPRSIPELPGIDNSCYGYDTDNPASFCNTDAYIQRVNQTNYCGFSDWRLPTADELLSLTDPALLKLSNQSAIDLRYFPFNDPFAYWTSTVNEEDVVITVIKGNKRLANSIRSDHLLVRLVRDN